MSTVCPDVVVPAVFALDVLLEQPAAARAATATAARAGAKFLFLKSVSSRFLDFSTFPPADGAVGHFRAREYGSRK
jgi:hypothetical protein